MELKKIAKKISLANDINTLSIEDLANKYLKSKTTYEKFLKDYEEMFGNDSIYQLRVFNKYEKIEKLLDYGYVMYPSDKSEDLTKNILSYMDYNLKYNNYNKIKEDVAHSDYSFDIITGAYRAKHEETYEQKIKGMDKAIKKYEACKGKTLEDFGLFANMIRYCVNPENFDRHLSLYMETHPLMRECNDIYYLYFVNYVLSKNNIVDPKFIDDAKSVIGVSRIFDRQLIHPIIKNKDYNRVAKYTLKNIKRYEENLARREENNDQVVLRK